MSTRANIAILNRDKSVEVIYTHNDGYPSHHGTILLEHYNTEEKVRELLKLGDLSVLAENIGEKHNFEWYQEHSVNGNIDWDKVAADPRDKMCKAYGRDRGEKGTKARKYKSMQEVKDKDIFDNDYAYVFYAEFDFWLFAPYGKDLKTLTKKACK